MTQTSLSEPVRLGTAGSNARQFEEDQGARRNKVWRFVRRMALPAAILIAWEAVTAAGWVSSASLPSPTAVVIAWWDWIFGPRQRACLVFGHLGRLRPHERGTGCNRIRDRLGRWHFIGGAHRLVFRDGGLVRRSDQLSARRTDDRLGAVCSVPFRYPQISGDFPDRLRIVFSHRRERCSGGASDAAHPDSCGAHARNTSAKAAPARGAARCAPGDLHWPSSRTRLWHGCL